jgi:serine protease Do
MNKHIRTTGVVLAALVAVFVFYGIHGPLFTGNSNNVVHAQTASPQDRPIASLRDFNKALVDIASQVKPTVVTVFTEKTMKLQPNMFGNPFADFFGQRPPQQTPQEREYVQQGMGSGVIVSADGYILTNNHVVTEADSIFVRAVDDKRYAAKVIGADPKTDIAVIKIEAAGLTAIHMGDSDDLQVGELVLAVGSPMSANLAHTVTQGIVSAKGRSNIGLADYEDFIQTDAAINPGNSGGALVNLDGELIGINTAIVSRSGGSQGIGFAVPVNMAMSVMNSLIDHGKVIRGWLGVSIQNINDAMAEAMALKTKDGALVGDVLADSPASKAGMMAGDIITELEGKKVADATGLRNRIAAISPGTTVTFGVLREDSHKSIKVELGEFPSETEVAAVDHDIQDLLGFSVANLDRQTAERYRLDPQTSGIVVNSIDATSAAYRAGLREGDVILGANRRRVESIESFRDSMTGLSKGNSVLLRILRDSGSFYLAFTL